MGIFSHEKIQNMYLDLTGGMPIVSDKIWHRFCLKAKRKKQILNFDGFCREVTKICKKKYPFLTAYESLKIIQTL